MKNTRASEPDISVLVPISERHDDLSSIFYAHKDVLESEGLSFEFIFVLDGHFPEAAQSLVLLKKAHQDLVTVITFNRKFGEAKAIMAAFAESSGKRILTLASYLQVKPTEIGKLVSALGPSVDVAFGQRYPRRDSIVNKIQSTVFHKLANTMCNESFHDISCGVRLLKRAVLEKIELYGDLHRFIPLLAVNKGYRVQEVPLGQAEEDIHLRIFRPGVYLQRLLDILTLFFLIKFTHKPLRFFGLLGFGITFIGAIITGITVWQRVVYNHAMADRPLFLMGLFFSLIGLQTFFIGLVAEIIIYLHKPAQPEYTIEQIIE